MIKKFEEQFDCCKMLRHSFYKDYWTNGLLNRDILAKYAKEYFYIEKTFIECLRILLERSKESKKDSFYKIISENISDELGLSENQLPHLKLLILFANEFGVTEFEIKNQEINFETQVLINNFKTVCSSSLYAGIGVMFAYEYQIPEIAKTKIEGLKKFYQVTKEESLSFFKVHMQADVWHTEQWKTLFNDFSEEQIAEFRNGFAIGLKSLHYFLDGMMRVSKLSFI